MLIEIYSKPFMKNATESWGPIPLRPGLNIVVGGDRSDNNIGKSSFLLAIDFCFGGDTYPKREVFDLVKDYPVCWKMKFGDETHCFMRYITKKDEVFICNDDYSLKELSPISIEEYRSFLFQKYKLKWQGADWSIVTKVFSRIDPKQNTSDYRKPLKMHGANSDADSITLLERLLLVYEKISQQKDFYAERQKDGSALAKAEGRKIISTITEDEYKANLDEIDRLQGLLKEWGFTEIKKQVLEEDETDETLARTEEILKSLRSERYALYARRAALSSLDTKYNPEYLTRDLARLNAFLKDAINLDAVEQVQSFHETIHKILSAQIKEELESIRLKIEDLNNQIVELSKQTVVLQKPAGVSAQYVEDIARTRADILRLQDINETYLKRKAIKDDLSLASEELKKVEPEVLQQIQTSINDLLKKFFFEMFHNEQRIHPEIAIPSRSKYQYLTADDGSYGSKQRDLILFDLAMSKLAAIPVLIHDNNHNKNIEDETLEKLLKIYLNCSKERQFFVAIDALPKITDPEIGDIIQKATIMTLSKSQSIYLYGRDLRKGTE